MLDDGEYKEVAYELHDYFVDHFNAESKRVSTKMETLADEAIKACLEVNDVENAKVIYRDYY